MNRSGGALRAGCAKLDKLGEPKILPSPECEGVGIDACCVWDVGSRLDEGWISWFGVFELDSGFVLIKATLCSQLQSWVGFQSAQPGGWEPIGKVI